MTIEQQIHEKKEIIKVVGEVNKRQKRDALLSGEILKLHESELEELERKQNMRAVDKETYHYLNISKGSVQKFPAMETNGELDQQRFDSGNYFLDKEDAQREADFINTHLRIRKWQRENDCGDLANTVYVPLWYFECNELCEDAFSDNSGEIYYFSTEEIAEKFITEMGDVYKRHILGVS